MLFNWISKNPARADESRMGAIHRPIHCHPERSEGSVAMGSEMLRCAQHDRAVTQTNVWINVFMCMIGPLRSLIYPTHLESKKCANEIMISICKIIKHIIFYHIKPL